MGLEETRLGGARREGALSVAEDLATIIPSSETDGRDASSTAPDSFGLGTTPVVPDTALRPAVGHPLLCREAPSATETLSAEDFDAFFECRMTEIDGHIEAGRLEEASRLIRETNATWRNFNAAHREIPQSERSEYLGRLYLARSRIEATHGGDRALWRTYYEARGYDLTGDHARARLRYRSVMAMPAPARTPETLEIGRTCMERRRALELESIERLRERNGLVLEARRDQFGPAGSDERRAAEHEVLLDRLEHYLESGEARTVDQALEIYRRDLRASDLTGDDLPSHVTLRPGWTLRASLWSDEIRVTVPPEGGAIAVAGELVYVFPPSEGAREVTVRRGNVLCAGLREGEDFYRETPIAFGPGETSVDGLRERDAQFYYLLEMETGDGLARMDDPDSRNHYLFVEGMTLMDETIWGVDGSHRIAAGLFHQIFEPELERARDEVGRTGDAETDELRAMERLNAWFTSGELAERDGTVARAWEQYVRLENPLHEWDRLTYGEQISLGHTGLLLAMTGPLFELVAPEAAGVAGAPLLTRLGFALRSGMTFGATMTTVRTAVEMDVDPVQSVMDVLMGGAFGVGGEVTGPVLFRLLGRTAVGGMIANWFGRTAAREAAGETILHVTGGLGGGTLLSYANPFDGRGFLPRFLENAMGVGVFAGSGSRRSARSASEEPVVGVRQMVRGIWDHFFGTLETSVAPEISPETSSPETAGDRPTVRPGGDREGATVRPGRRGRRGGDVDPNAMAEAAALLRASRRESFTVGRSIRVFREFLDGVLATEMPERMTEMGAREGRGYMEGLRDILADMETRFDAALERLDAAENAGDRGGAAEALTELNETLPQDLRDLIRDNWHRRVDEAMSGVRSRLFPLESALVRAQNRYNEITGRSGDTPAVTGNFLSMGLEFPRYREGATVAGFEPGEAVFEVSVGDSMGESLFLQQLDVQEGVVSVESIGEGRYRVRMDDGTTAEVRCRAEETGGADPEGTSEGSWLEEIETGRDDLRAFDDARLGELADYLVGRGWNLRAIETFVRVNGGESMMGRLDGIMERRASREARIEGEAP